MATIIDNIVTKARALVSRLKTASSSEQDASKQNEQTIMPRIASEPIVSIQHSSLQTYIAEFDRGQFEFGSLLTDFVLRHAETQSAFLQRVTLFQEDFEPEFEIETEDDALSAQDQAMLDLLKSIWPSMLDAGTLFDLYRDVVFAGFAVARVVWSPSPEGGLQPKFMYWPIEAIEHRSYDSSWYANTSNAQVKIDFESGEWLLFAPRGKAKPWLMGAVRAVAGEANKSFFASNDSSRRAEVLGSTIIKALMPNNALKTKDGEVFVEALKNIGRKAVVACPQGKEKDQSFDLHLLEGDVDGYKIFEYIDKTTAGKVRLAILGQDLTSQNNKVGTNASSETGQSILQSLVNADLKCFAQTLTWWVANIWCAYMGANQIEVCIDTEQEDDFAKVSEGQEKAGKAAQLWRSLGVNVDLVAMAKNASVPLIDDSVVNRDNGGYDSAKVQSNV